MSDQQPAVVDLLSLETIQNLARPSDLRYGQAIHDRGAVTFIAWTPSQVEAWVGGLDGKVVEGC